MRTVRWSRDAQADVASIDSHYHQLNPGYAARVARLAVRAGRFLAENPEAGPPVGNQTRKWRVSGTPYLLFYRPEEKVLRIVRIMHAARNWRGEIA